MYIYFRGVMFFVGAVNMYTCPGSGRITWFLMKLSTLYYEFCLYVLRIIFSAITTKLFVNTNEKFEFCLQIFMCFYVFRISLLYLTNICVFVVFYLFGGLCYIYAYILSDCSYFSNYWYLYL